MRYLFAVVTFFILTTSLLGVERKVTDAMGREILIPEDLKRIVVMSEPAVGLPLIELGIQPVGSYGRADDGTYKLGADFIDTVMGPGLEKPKGIGLGGQIELEKLYALKPDIIFGIEFDVNKVDQLSTVAPVYLMKFLAGSSHNFNIEETLAKLTKRETVFRQRHNVYDQHVKTTQSLLKGGGFGQTYLAVMVSDKLNLVGGGTGVTQALEDVGYKRLNLGGLYASSDSEPELLLQLNPESFGTLDPDILVIINGWGNSLLGEAATRAALDKVVPNWQDYMKAAREKRVIFVDAAKVFTPTFASAEHMLAALGNWAKQNR